MNPDNRKNVTLLYINIKTIFFHDNQKAALFPFHVFHMRNDYKSKKGLIIYSGI